MRRALATDAAGVAGHALAELYAVLTTLPVSPRITPEQAQKLVRTTVTSRMEVVVLDADDYEAVIARLTELGFTGGVVYHALHLRAAEKSGAESLVTFNRRDFDRLAAGSNVELTFL